MEIQQVQKQTQQFVLTTEMRQSLHILQLPLLELKGYIEQQIEENPVIEAEISADTEKDQTSLDKLSPDYEVEENPYQDMPFGDYPKELKEDKNYPESLVAKPFTLQEILLQQLRICKINEKQKYLGELLIQHIDENGYLTASLEEIINYLNKKILLDDKKCAEKELEDVLKIIQTFDPSGVGGRNLRECLLIQLRRSNKEKTLIYTLVKDFLPEVAKSKVNVIAKKLKINPEKVRKTIQQFSQLEPKPGRLFSPYTNLISKHSTPDIIVEKRRERNEIIINHLSLPRLGVRAQYKNLLKSNVLSPEVKTYIKEKIKSALGLIKAVAQREDTLKKVTQCILEQQKEFFTQGDDTLLKPLTLKEVAKKTDRNESTISRVVNSKYIQTPYGTFKLNYFFVKPLKNKNNYLEKEAVSKEMIKSEIFHLVSEENKNKPLTDSEITKSLKNQGIVIARRTITKYRKNLKIPPAHKRRDIKKTKEER